MYDEVAGVGVQMLFLWKTTSWKQTFRMSLPVKCGTVAQWVEFPVMWERSALIHVTFSSLIGFEIQGVMACIQYTPRSGIYHNGWWYGMKRKLSLSSLDFNTHMLPLRDDKTVRSSFSLVLLSFSALRKWIWEVSAMHASILYKCFWLRVVLMW